MRLFKKLIKYGKPCKADNDRELDTVDLEQILLRDRELLTVEDIERVAGHFQSKIHTEKAKLEEETKKPLTNTRRQTIKTIPGLLHWIKNMHGLLVLGTECWS